MEKVNGVGLALCGGGFRSFAEVAALEDMEHNGISCGAVAGTSMGAFLAALVGAGLDATKVADTLVAMDHYIVEKGLLTHMRLRLLNVISEQGAISSQILADVAREFLTKEGISTFADFTMPVAFAAQDVISGELCVFTNDAEFFAPEGDSWVCITGDDLDVATCVAASASYPLFISPTSYAGRVFIDGGCRINLPTPLFDRSRVDAVVGVAMRAPFEPLDEVSALNIARRTMSCGADQLDRINAQVADLFINLPVGYTAFDAGNGVQIISQARALLKEHPVDWSIVKPGALTAVRRAAVDMLSNLVRGRSD